MGATRAIHFGDMPALRNSPEHVGIYDQAAVIALVVNDRLVVQRKRICSQADEMLRQNVAAAGRRLKKLIASRRWVVLVWFL